MKMNVRIAQQRVKDMFSLIFTAHFESMHRIYCEWMSPCTHLTTGGFENCVNIYCPQIYILYHRISYSILNGITDKHSLIWYDIISSNLDSLLNLNFCVKNQIRLLRSQNFPHTFWYLFPFYIKLTSSPSHCEHWTLCAEQPFQELSFHLVTL